MPQTPDQLIALRRQLEEADAVLAQAQAAQERRVKLRQQLRKAERKAYLDRIYDVGRLAYDLGLAGLDDELLAGILARGKQAATTHEVDLRNLGMDALDELQRTESLRVAFRDRPDVSTAATLREMGLRKSPKGEHRDGVRWTVYVGQANLPILRRRLAGTGAEIRKATS